VFYAQTRGLLDFLIAQSRDARILNEIARSLKEGVGLDQWLAGPGSKHGLPATVAGLERRFIDWARSEQDLEPADSGPLTE